MCPEPWWAAGSQPLQQAGLSHGHMELSHGHMEEVAAATFQSVKAWGPRL